MHHAILETRSQTWPDEAGCVASAQALAGALVRVGANAVIELHGTLGAGKTTFARHLLRALGVAGRIKSPSYAVVEPYEIDGKVLWHFDFYRFSDPEEWEDAGFRDIFGSPGLKLVEWPEKAGGLLPRPDLRIVIVPRGESTREVTFQACTSRGQALLP